MEEEAAAACSADRQLARRCLKRRRRNTGRDARVQEGKGRCVALKAMEADAWTHEGQSVAKYVAGHRLVRYKRECNCWSWALVKCNRLDVVVALALA